MSTVEDLCFAMFPTAQWVFFNADLAAARLLPLSLVRSAACAGVPLFARTAAAPSHRSKHEATALTTTG